MIMDMMSMNGGLMILKKQIGKNIMNLELGNGESK